MKDEGALHLDDLLARRTRMSIEYSHRGVDWPDAADAAQRYRVMLDGDVPSLAAVYSFQWSLMGNLGVDLGYLGDGRSDSGAELLRAITYRRDTLDVVVEMALAGAQNGAVRVDNRIRVGP